MSPKHVVFKKFLRDKSIGVYMGKRDFVDYCDFVEPIDGVVVVDPVLLKGKKVYVSISCTFRYGPDDQEVIGIKFCRDIYMCTQQVYPPLLDRDKSIHTRTQERLLHKLGENAHPFFFELPDNLPCSVCLQPAPTDVGKYCAVEFEVKAFAAKDKEDKVQKRNCVSLAIRKVQYAPDQGGPPPSVETINDFSTPDKPLYLKASLEKQTYYHGEPIKVHLNINNNSNKTVKIIIITVEQVANVVLYSNDSYMEIVATEEPLDTVESGDNLDKEYCILPLLANNRHKRGIVLDGKLKQEDTNLASSSIIKDEVLKEVLGILVSYRLVVKLIVGGLFGTSDVQVELPFQLMHPRPDLEKESDQEEMDFQDFKRHDSKEMVNDEEEDVPPAGE
ncbi:S-arrestin a [Brienomyrus brachyistius]|uniref:S-arrestin a n=1 Tax=Brienomyrus brachyistius TaxID=42636 RepID=UPI0020B2F05B|nr:S-arrestin a [Brienomyrus brachyistius]